MADGGDGTLDALVEAGDGWTTTCEACDALGRPLRAAIGWLDSDTAIIESATLCGLAALRPDELSPQTATSRGVGLALIEAVNQGAKRVMVAIGGTATVDAGLGMLEVLGAVASDGHGERINADPLRLEHIARIDLEPALKRLDDIELVALCDVASPLLGAAGARQYMAQKGVDEALAEHLEAGFAHFSKLITPPLHRLPGTGAGGGLGFACALLGGRLRRASALIGEMLGLDEAIERCDVVVTGEGRLDLQSAEGKVVWLVTKRAKAQAKPVVAVCGQVTMSTEELRQVGIDVAVELADANPNLIATLWSDHKPPGADR